MMTEVQYRGWLQPLELSPAAQAVIDSVRSTPPSRHVRASARNVAGRFPSRKMGVTIQFESHQVELAAIYLMEHDRDVLEFYDQPSAINLKYPDPKGRRVGVLHTPDFFVLRTDAAGWEEWKPEAELVRLAARSPGRYVRRDGRWHCPPGEAYAEPLGLFYHLRSSAEIDWTLQRNLRLLGDYMTCEPPAMPAETRDAVLTRVAAEPGVTVATLLTEIAGLTPDALYPLIVTEQVFVDLARAPVAEADRVVVFRDRAVAEACAVMTAARSPSAMDPPRTVDLVGGAAILWDGRPWRLANVGERTITLLGDADRLEELPCGIFDALLREGKVTGVPSTEPGLPAEARQRLARASPKDLEEANRRAAIIAPCLAGDRPPGDTPGRTLRVWLARYREAEQAYGAGFLGLLPRHAGRGNRRRKLPDRVVALMDTVIEEHYETLSQKRKLAVYGILVRSCQAEGLMTPSFKTFCLAVQRRPRIAQIAKRAGPRAAYAYESAHLELTLTTPRHGDRPFEIGHIDHTELDVELVCAETGRNLGRPWLTILVDAYARRLLAIYVTFDPPSYRSAMMVLRECVHRHSRLPETVVVDGGREFGSVYFETLLARYACMKKTRPAAKARFGAVCERLFGTTNTRFIHTLLGNTQVMTNVRQVTKALSPRAQAQWTLERLYARVCEWAYEIYDTTEHPALGMTPREAFTVGVSQLGERAHRRIPYDDDFRMLTLPSTRRGTAKVDPRLGVKINYLHYWADAFRDPEIARTQVPVRYDPFDAGTAYAFVRGRWVKCISEHFTRFQGRSERELLLATEELHARHRRHGRRLTVTARQLADFLDSLDAEERLASQRLRDRATRGALQVVQGTQPAGGAPTPTVAPITPRGAGPRPEVLSAMREEPARVSAALTPYGDY